MNLKRLRYFTVLAEELHFGRAADRLHMARPPLSQQIQVFEEELGISLFDRSTRRVALTEAGQFLYADAKRLLVEVDLLERRISKFGSGEVGVLRLGFAGSASYDVLPLFVRSFRSRWPGIECDLRSMPSDAQHQGLQNGEIDLGISRIAPAGDSLNSTIFFQEPLYLAVAAEHRLASQKQVSLHDFTSEEIIGFDRRASEGLFHELQDMFAAVGVDYDPEIEVAEYSTVVGLAASGQGIAIVPACLRTLKPPNLKYVDLVDETAVSSLFLLSRKGETSPVVSHATNLIKKLFAPPPSARTETAAE